jgi:ribonuclease HI
MILLAWNCRGLGLPRTVQELVQLVRTYRPRIVFITETRQGDKKIKELRCRLGLKNCISQKSIGKGAGIALYWDEQIEIKVLSEGPRYFDVLVNDIPNGRKWRGTFVYGEPKSSERHHFWTTIRRIKPKANEPWLMMGDFNETKWQHEHLSETKRSEKRMAEFRSLLNFCNLQDITYVGPPWTFDNKRKGDQNVKARIDRAVASQDWSVLYPQAKITHICSTRSDHLPLLLDCENLVPQNRPPGTFRYEHMWERETSLPTIIEEAWNNSPPCASLNELMEKITNTSGHLKEWSTENFGMVTKQIKNRRAKLSKLWKRPRTAARDDYVRKISLELDELLHREEMMWRQRSRVSWLKEGDRNTSYFHRKSSWRQSKNTIKRIRGLNGNWTDDPEDIKKLANDFFKELYTNNASINPSDLLDLVHTPIDSEINANLCRDFSDEEIGDALFQIGPLKAPGPDGMPGRFFQRNWATMKDDVTKAVKDFFRTGVIPEGLNDTVIVLIPKGPSPETLAEYRPISLCNVIYKIISKCLVNRLRPLLDELISETQSAFIPGRLITDNAVIAFESFHKIQRSKNPRDNHCAYKLDLSKAYDRVDWGFLEKTLLKMGFCKKWTNWVMSCVRSARLSVRINGHTHEPFCPSRGLRQGDPLSPYLFLFVGEALSCILNKETRERRITPLKVARGAPGVSSLLFADDSLLFFKATVEEARAVDSALELFQRCTGQLLSPSKCSVLFSSACPSATQLEIKSILGVSTSTFEEKYLGLPTPEGRMKDECFQPIMARFSKKLNNWNEKFMSHAAKDTLIKAVAQSLPAYVMGVFKMSTGFCENYEKIIRDFWWGDEENQRKVHWSAWDNLIKPKAKGGLGFRDISLFNQALLARMAWRLIQRPNSLCARVLKARYYPHGNILDTVFASDPSPAWKGVEHGLELLKKGIISRIGDGRNTQILRDQWIPRDAGLKITALKKNSRKRWVNQLISPTTNSWNTDLLRELFYEHDVQAITEIEIPSTGQGDRIAWHFERNGVFTVKSAYRLGLDLKHRNRDISSCSMAPNGDRSVWNSIWKSKVQPKIQVFGWRVATDTLATMKNKWRRTLELNDRCHICGNDTEDAHHATVRCTKASALRHAMRKIWTLPDEYLFRYTGKDWLQLLLSQVNEVTKSRILMLLWRSWHLRNDVIHHQGRETIEQSVAFLESYAHADSQQAPVPGDPKGKRPMFVTTTPAERGQSSSTVNVWSAPPDGWIKINSDASFSSVGKPGGAGAVVRDSQGKVILAACSPITHCFSAEEAEAKAALMAIKLIQDRGYEKIILEMDCAVAVGALRSAELDRSRLWSTYDETKSCLKKYGAYRILHVKRESNKVG